MSKKNQVPESNYFLHITFLLLTLSIACNNNETNKHDIKEIAKEVNISSISANDAIEKVKYHITQSRKTVVVQASYWDTEWKRVSCTQYDIDLGIGTTCSGNGGTYGYGYKKVLRNVRKCCRPKTITVSNQKGNWTADYLQQSDNWQVKLEFSIDDMKNTLSWNLRDKTGNVSETD